jgi:hypothetical protein
VALDQVRAGSRVAAVESAATVAATVGIVGGRRGVVRVVWGSEVRAVALDVGSSLVEHQVRRVYRPRSAALCSSQKKGEVASFRQWV